METYSRIGLLRSYGNLQSYWTTTKPWELTVVLDYYAAKETYSRIGVHPLSSIAIKLFCKVVKPPWEPMGGKLEGASTRNLPLHSF